MREIISFNNLLGEKDLEGDLVLGRAKERDYEGFGNPPAVDIDYFLPGKFVSVGFGFCFDMKHRRPGGVIPSEPDLSLWLYHQESEKVEKELCTSFEGGRVSFPPDQYFLNGEASLLFGRRGHMYRRRARFEPLLERVLEIYKDLRNADWMELRGSESDHINYINKIKDYSSKKGFI